MNMAADTFVAELLEEIRSKLPTDVRSWYWERDQHVAPAVARLKDASNESAVEFILASLRMVHDEPRGMLADVLQKAASEVLRRKLPFTTDQVVEMIGLVSVPNQSFPYKGVLKAAESVAMTPAMGEALRVLRPCITEYLGGTDMRDLHARIDIC